jgi:hypothetical protein
VNATRAHKIAPNTWFAANFSVGRTGALDNADSVISAISATTSYSWSLGMLSSDKFTAGDRIGFSLTQPLKAVSGHMALNSPVGVAMDNSIIFQQQQLSLKPSATEFDLEANYMMPVGNDKQLSAALIHRMNPGHDAYAQDETVLGFRYSVNW